MASAPGSPFDPFLQNGTVVLDGGLSTSLPNGLEDHFLWAHQLLYGMDGGLDVLKKVHREFLDNGADVIGTLTYKFSAETLNAVEKAGLLKDIENNHLTVGELMSRSVGAAVQARDEFWEEYQASVAGSSSGSQDGFVTVPKSRSKPLVFGSCGPFNDNDVFKGATDPNTKGSGDDEESVLRCHYSMKIALLKAAGVDGIAAESLPGKHEAMIAAEEMEKAGVPGWISFCCQDDAHTNNGELLSDCVKAVSSVPAVKAVGMNCFNPKYAESLIQIAKENTDRPIGVYPNSGEIWDARQGERCWHSGTDMKVLTGQDALAFKRAGACLIGGCCRVTPKQIGLFREALDMDSCDVLGNMDQIQQNDGEVLKKQQVASQM